MILAVDIGNTTISVALISNQMLIAQRKVLTNTPYSKQDYLNLFNRLLCSHSIHKKSVSVAAICCVVPDRLLPIQQSLEDLLCKKCFIVKPGIQIGMKVFYDPPSSVGADRIVNSFCVRNKYGFPSICIDFGTASNFCVIDDHGNFVGGSIVPGVKSMTGILHNKTSMLPSVDFRKPNRVIGNSTVQNLESGLFFGYVDMIEGMIRRITRELDCSPIIVATGGNSTFFKSEISAISVFDPHLTLLGLESLFNYQKQSDCTAGVW